MKADGLYQVTTGYLCAGFVIEGGKVAECAPILRRNLDYWMTLARRVDHDRAPKARYFKPIEPVPLTEETEAWLAELDDTWPRWNDRCEIVDYWSERMWCRAFCWCFEAKVVA